MKTLCIPTSQPPWYTVTPPCAAPACAITTVTVSLKSFLPQTLKSRVKIGKSVGPIRRIFNYFSRHDTSASFFFPPFHSLHQLGGGWLSIRLTSKRFSITGSNRKDRAGTRHSDLVRHLALR